MEIADFAAQYGLLQWPRSRARSTGIHVPPTEGVEETAVWRAIAGDLTALLGIAAGLHQGKLPASGEWSSFSTFTARLKDDSAHGRLVSLNLGRRNRAQQGSVAAWGLPPSPALMGEHQAVGWILSMWLFATGARVQMNWLPGQQPAMAVSAPGLLAALVVQTAQTVGRATGFAICRGCSSPFPLQHRNRRYCDECRDLREPQRAAEAAYRRRRSGR